MQAPWAGLRPPAQGYADALTIHTAVITAPAFPIITAPFPLIKRAVHGAVFVMSKIRQCDGFLTARCTALLFLAERCPRYRRGVACVPDGPLRTVTTIKR